jgi:hypothetical protein
MTVLTEGNRDEKLTTKQIMKQFSEDTHSKVSNSNRNWIKRTIARCREDIQNTKITKPCVADAEEVSRLRRQTNALELRVTKLEGLGIRFSQLQQRLHKLEAEHSAKIQEVSDTVTSFPKTTYSANNSVQVDVLSGEQEELTKELTSVQGKLDNRPAPTPPQKLPTKAELLRKRLQAAKRRKVHSSGPEPTGRSHQRYPPGVWSKAARSTLGLGYNRGKHTAVTAVLASHIDLGGSVSTNLLEAELRMVGVAQGEVSAIYGNIVRHDLLTIKFD